MQVIWLMVMETVQGSTFSEQLVNEKYFMERKLMVKFSDWSMNEKVDGEALQQVDEALQLVDE